jgi:hypothetical protein
VDASVNCTVSGTTPVTGFAEKAAATGRGGTRVVAVAVGDVVEVVVVEVGITVTGAEGGRLRKIPDNGAGMASDCPTCPDPPVFLNTSPRVGGNVWPVVL